MSAIIATVKGEKMRFTDLLREVGKKYPQHFDGLFSEDHQSFCVIGMIGKHLGLAPADYEFGESNHFSDEKGVSYYEDSILCAVNVDPNLIVANRKGVAVSLRRALVEMNDFDKLTCDQIADHLEFQES